MNRQFINVIDDISSLVRNWLTPGQDAKLCFVTIDVIKTKVDLPGRKQTYNFYFSKAFEHWSHESVEGPIVPTATREK